MKEITVNVIALFSLTLNLDKLKCVVKTHTRIVPRLSPSILKKTMITSQKSVIEQ